MDAIIAIPYPGLRPFEKEDHPIFFGREAQIDGLLNLLEDSSFVAVLGSSGCGKSSLVRGGLLPVVERGFLLATRDWRFIVFKPGDQPYRRLAQEILIHLAAGRGVNDAKATKAAQDQWRELLLLSDDGLLTAIAAADIPRDTRVLVVVDQFEELFAFRRPAAQRENVVSRDEAAAFVAMLLRCSRDTHGPVRVVLTMRSDFVGDCEAFLGLPEAISRSQFLVPRLDRAQMRDTIVRPGLAHGAFSRFSVDEDLVNRIINDAGDQPDQLPLMQHALLRTWKAAVPRAAADNSAVRLTAADYDDAGCIAEALSLHAEDAWKQLGGDARREEIARRLFLLLCEESRDGQITRRRPRVEEVIKVTGATLQDLEAVIRVFQEDDRNFILPPLVERDGERKHLQSTDRLDISHEALLRQWPKYKQWQEEERADASEFSRLVEAANNREAGKGGLLPAEDLGRVDKWRKRVSPNWAARYTVHSESDWQAASKFITASKDKVTRDNLRAANTRKLVWSGVVVVVIALTLFWRQDRYLKGQITQILIDQLATTVGISKAFEPSSTERESLWQLAELAAERKDVRTGLIDTWFGGQTLVNALRHNARALQAAVGIDDTVRMHVSDKAVVLLDAFVANPRQELKSGEERLDPADLVPWVDGERLNALAIKIGESLAAKELPGEHIAFLEAAGPRFLPDAARTIGSRLTELSNNPATFSRFTKVLESFSDVVPPDHAAVLSERVLTLAETPSSYIEIERYISALSRMIARLDPPIASALAARALHQVMATCENETYLVFPSDFGAAMTRLIRYVTEQNAADAANRLVPLLTKGTPDDLRLTEVSRLIAALMPRVSASDRADIAQKMVAVSSDGASIRPIHIVDSLAAVAADMPPDTAAGVVRLMIRDTSPESLERLQKVSRALGVIAKRAGGAAGGEVRALVQAAPATDPARATFVVDVAADVLTPDEIAQEAALMRQQVESTYTAPRLLYTFGPALVALYGRVKPSDIAELTQKLAIEAILSRGAQSRRAALATFVPGLAALLSREEAISLANELFKQIGDAEGDGRGAPRDVSVLVFADILTSLLKPMTDDEKTTFGLRGARVLVQHIARGVEADSATLAELGTALGRLVAPIPHALPQTSRLALSLMFLLRIPEAHRNGTEELINKLPDPQTFELLKWPVTVGDAQALVLTVLERRGKTAATRDMFAVAAQARRVGVDRGAPPKRPTADEAWRELEQIR